MRVLVADDSRTIRGIAREILQRMGYAQVAEASDGREALGRFGSFQPQMLILERDLPEIDGISIVRALRSQGRSLPIVMLSDRAHRDQVMEALNAGVSSYVMKPFTPAVLTERIREAVSRSRAA
ncbi:MAG: response regulator [Phycisphaerales bacterium]|nr:response regulator [Phycisphaerales bacterium]